MPARQVINIANTGSCPCAIFIASFTGSGQIINNARIDPGEVCRYSGRRPRPPSSPWPARAAASPRAASARSPLRCPWDEARHQGCLGPASVHGVSEAELDHARARCPEIFLGSANTNTHAHARTRPVRNRR